MTQPAKPVTRLQLLRHGEVESRYQRVFGGRIDMDLSPQGHAQADALGRYLRRHRVDVVYTSPMKRARQTVEAVVSHTGHAPKTVDDFVEVDFGDWSGLRWHEVRERFGVEAYDWLHHLERHGMPNGEGAAAFRQRVERGLKPILEEHQGQTIAVLCHGGVIRMILSILLEVPLPKTAAFEVDYASLTELQLHPHRTELQVLNLAPWREFV